MGTTVSEINVGFHAGNVINILAQMQGATGFDVLDQAVQNAIDEGADDIFVRIDCPKRLIVVYDNGRGASVQDITSKFENIGLSLKLNNVHYVDPTGGKGIGNLAGLAVAERWQLITKEIHSSEPMHLFEFNRKELVKSNMVKIHMEPIVQLKELTGAPIQATTMLRLLEVDEITLRQLGDKDTVERTLQDAFNSKLKSKGINLRVSYKDFRNRSFEFIIKPTRFRGTPLEAVSYNTEYGEIVFAFNHSYTPLTKPVVLVQHLGVYSFPLSNLFKLKVLSSKFEQIFMRGYFEGEIRLGFCKLNPSRSSFEHDYQMKTFISVVEAFAEDALEPLIQQFEQTDRDERLKRIAEKVLRRVKNFLVEHPSLIPASLVAVVFKKGSGEVDDAEKMTGIPGEYSASVLVKKTVFKPAIPAPIVTPPVTPRQPLAPDALKEQREKSRKVKAERKPSERKIERRVVEVKEGLSIQLVVPDPNEEGFKWNSRIMSGVVQINVVSDIFLQAERRGATVLDRYMSLLVHKELTCASLPQHDAEVFDRGFEKKFLDFCRASFLE